MTSTISATRLCCHLRQCSILLRTMSSNTTEGGGVVPLAEVERFITDCFMKVGTNKEPAKQMADLLVAADYRGHFSHGLNRLEFYLKDIEKKLCDPNAEPVVESQTGSTVLVNGMNGLGAVVGNFCMKKAIEKARQTGVGWVVANHSNHYGMAGYYSLQASQVDLIGLSFTNSSPLVCPTRAKDAALGTNPLSLSAPAGPNDDFTLDMATSSVALGKIEMQIRKGEPIPLGWAQDKDGKPTTDAKVAYDATRLMPLGGAEENSGYKGYGLAMLVEIFCGISSASSYGPWIRDWTSDTTSANLGHCFIVVDPKCFAKGFADRLQQLMQFIRGMVPIDPEKPVMVPGDPEKINMKKVDGMGGILYHPNQIESAVQLANRLEVKPMEVLKQSV